MRNKCVQMSLYDTYKCVAASMEDDKPKLFRELDEHIDWDSLIPARFYLAFYRNIGRPRKYPLVAFLKSLVLQKIFGYVNDSVLLVTLRHSREVSSTLALSTEVTFFRRRRASSKARRPIRSISFSE